MLKACSTLYYLEIKDTFPLNIWTFDKNVLNTGTVNLERINPENNIFSKYEEVGTD